MILFFEIKESQVTSKLQDGLDKKCLSGFTRFGRGCRKSERADMMGEKLSEKTNGHNPS